MSGFKPGTALAYFAHHLLTGHDLAGGNLRLTAGKGLKPSGGCLGKGWVVIHGRNMGKPGRIFHSDVDRPYRQPVALAFINSRKKVIHSMAVELRSAQIKRIPGVSDLL
jgi:hypothetical protein